MRKLYKANDDRAKLVSSPVAPFGAQIPAVVAALAVKLELKPGIGSRMHGMVGEVLAEFDFAHAWPGFSGQSLAAAT
jgi:hypothetical protein